MARLSMDRFAACLCFLVLGTSPSWAQQAYYVAEGGGEQGATGRDWDHAWSVQDFNSSDNWSQEPHRDRINPGDTVFFRGTIESQLKPGGSGSAAGHVIIDGYEGTIDGGGECDPLQAECTAAALFTGGVWVQWGRDYLTFQDMRGSGGRITWQSFFSVYNDQSDDPSEQIILRRNYFHDTISSIVGIGGATDGVRSDDILIENNKFTNFGRTIDSAQGVNLVRTKNLVVRGNLIGHDEAVATKCTSANTIEVHYVQHALFEYNEIYGAPDQSGIAAKEYGNQDLIFRFNHFHHNGDDGEGRGLSINWPPTARVYIYGNLFHDHDFCGLDIFDGAGSVYVWSNVFFRNGSQGAVVWFAEGVNRYHADEGHNPPISYTSNPRVHDVTFRNNTFAENAILPHSPGQVTHSGWSVTDRGATNIRLENSILYNNRPEASSYQQVAAVSGVTGDVWFDANQYFHPGQVPTIYYDEGYRTRDEMVSLFQMERAGVALNPGFVDAAQHNFRLNGQSVDNGSDLSGLVATLRVRGVDYAMYWEDALSPTSDFYSVPPTVHLANQNEHGSGWERGAFVYLDPTTVNQRDAGSPAADAGGSHPDGTVDTGDAAIEEDFGALRGSACSLTGRSPSLSLVLLVGLALLHRRRNRQRKSDGSESVHPSQR